MKVLSASALQVFPAPTDSIIIVPIGLLIGNVATPNLSTLEMPCTRLSDKNTTSGVLHLG